MNAIELARAIVASHTEKTSWPSTRNSTDRRMQADGYLHYCDIDHNEPWPCEKVRLATALLREVEA